MTIHVNIKKRFLKLEVIIGRGCDFLFTEDKLSVQMRQQIIDVTDELRRKHNINPMNFDVIKFLQDVEGFSVESCSFKDKNITGVLLVDEECHLIWVLKK